jgi:hypothetical protein
VNPYTSSVMLLVSDSWLKFAYDFVSDSNFYKLSLFTITDAVLSYLPQKSVDACQCVNF